MQERIQGEVRKLTELLQVVQADQNLLAAVEQAAQYCIAALKDGRKVFFAGNGGSAADAQHLAAELVGRLNYNRPSLAGIALTTDTSALTAIGNDYAFADIFSRQLEALSQAGDVFVGISTSGKSPNILQALTTARDKKLMTIGFTGGNGEFMRQYCNALIKIPHTETCKIQECHIMFGHILCALIEDALFGAKYGPNAKLATTMATL